MQENRGKDKIIAQVLHLSIIQTSTTPCGRAAAQIRKPSPAYRLQIQQWQLHIHYAGT